MQQEQGRPFLQQGVEQIGLAGIEPHDIEEEAPAHRAGPRPYQPRRRQHHGNAGKLAQDQDAACQQVGRSLRGGDLDLPGRCVRRRGECDGGAAAGQHELHASDHCKEIAACLGIVGNAPHAREVEPVAGPDAGPMGRRPRRIVERASNVVMRSSLSGENRRIPAAGQPARDRARSSRAPRRGSPQA